MGRLKFYFQNPTEDQNKIIQLENEKHDYQIHAKDSLRAICLEKSDVARKCTDLENLLTTARIEVGHHKNLHETTQTELVKGFYEYYCFTIFIKILVATYFLPSMMYS